MENYFNNQRENTLAQIDYLYTTKDTSFRGFRGMHDDATMEHAKEKNNDLRNWEASKKSDGDRFTTHGLGKSRLKKEIKIKDGDAGSASKKFKQEYEKIISREKVLK